MSSVSRTRAVNSRTAAATSAFGQAEQVAGADFTQQPFLQRALDRQIIGAAGARASTACPASGRANSSLAAGAAGLREVRRRRSVASLARERRNIRAGRPGAYPLKSDPSAAIRSPDLAEGAGSRLPTCR